jgi:hypothetical protein
MAAESSTRDSIVPKHVPSGYKDVDREVEAVATAGITWKVARLVPAALGGRRARVPRHVPRQVTAHGGAVLRAPLGAPARQRAPLLVAALEGLRIGRTGRVLKSRGPRVGGERVARAVERRGGRAVAGPEQRPCRPMGHTPAQAAHPGGGPRGRGLPSECGCLGLNTTRSGVAPALGPGEQAARAMPGDQPLPALAMSGAHDLRIGDVEEVRVALVGDGPGIGLAHLDEVARSDLGIGTRYNAERRCDAISRR